MEKGGREEREEQEGECWVCSSYSLRFQTRTRPGWRLGSMGGMEAGETGGSLSGGDRRAFCPSVRRPGDAVEV
jgi:hypothetical protein